MSQENQDLALIDPDELSLVEDNSLNAYQLKMLLKKTPPQYVHKRPAKGGGEWEYVTGGYVKKVLNIMFGFDWSFEIVDQMIIHGEVVVKGKLTCHSNGRTIVKMQYGNKDIICKRGTSDPLSIGNDMKAAATDALKKCAAEIGIAADIYNKLDFREVNVDTREPATLEEIKQLYDQVTHDNSIVLSAQETANVERVISKEEKQTYNLMRDFLNKKINHL